MHPEKKKTDSHGPSSSVAPSCAAEMERWVEDIRMAIDLAEQSSGPHADLLATSLSDHSKSAALLACSAALLLCLLPDHLIKVKTLLEIF